MRRPRLASGSGACASGPTIIIAHRLSTLALADEPSSRRGRMAARHPMTLDELGYREIYDHGLLERVRGALESAHSWAVRRGPLTGNPWTLAVRSPPRLPWAGRWDPPHA
jgi:hypothetical protein